MAGKERVVVCNLGQMAYKPAWKLQKQLQAHLIAAKRADPPRRVDHVLLFVEHPPVYTLGKSGDTTNLLVPEDELEQLGASFFHIDRGGDITFHGPGQLVGYPILDLDRLNPDIHVYLRNLEEVIIRVCDEYGVEAGRVKGKTGVWITSETQRARKLCAMGIRCSRWVTMHGFAFNLNTDVSYFSNIIPCGITDGDVSSLARELGRPIDIEKARHTTTHHFSQIFDVDVRVLENSEAMEYLIPYL